MKITLPYNWEPRRYQLGAWNALVNEDCKRLCLVWHRRAGKDDLALHATAVKAHQRPATYWHMLPKAEQARKAIWEAVNPHTGIRRIDEAFPKELRESTREDTMTIKFRNGSTWSVVGSDNYNNLVGSPPAGVVFSEWALADPQAWAYIRPILAENDGWAMFIYTPRGPNHGLKTFELASNSEDWYAERLTVDDTHVFTDEQIRHEKQEMIAEHGPDQGEAFFRQEYYCSFDAAVIGAIYGKEMALAREQGRITHLTHDPYKPVGTMWDLGYTDSTAIWFFQLDGERIAFIDYFEASNEDLKTYAEILYEKKRRFKYNYARNLMLFPHDIHQTNIEAGKSRKRILKELGIPVVASRKPVPKWDGIEMVRRNFHRFWFDVDRCKRGIEALTLYKRKWDAKNRTFSTKPEHDWTSHAADALRIGIWQLPKKYTSSVRSVTLVDKDKPIDGYRRILQKASGIVSASPWAF